MSLPLAPAAYDASNERRTRAALEAADAQSFKKGQDLRLARGERLMLRSPDGTEWVVSVSDAGALVVTAT